MKCLSTRANNPNDERSLSEAIAAGLAPDGGLYLPTTTFHVGAPPHGPLAASAEWILAPVFAGDALASRLHDLCTNAFTFDAPLLPWGDSTWLLELFHGPTAAFKDFGARFLAECLTALSQQPQTILVATSGDTGAAVAAAFHRRPGFRVVILYPDGRVSARQAHQLGAFGDNISTYRVAGTFDDCQRMVKEAFSDAALKARAQLGSANSISLGRLLPQMAYYAHAALQLKATPADPMNVVVPSGNLGNAMACVLAKRAGVAIGHIALATNANQVLPDYFQTGTYSPKPSRATLANAMDVGAPSNVERLRALYPTPETAPFMTADAVDDATIRSTIAAMFQQFGVAICPHTACGVEVLRRLRAKGVTGRWVVAATAHAAKFADVVEPLIGHGVEVPASLAEMLARPAHATPMTPTLEALREVL